MAILFRCPCGRSMVAHSNRAGTVIQCPNCHRTLRVPSGKERGKELAPIPAIAKSPSTRLCDHCGHSVPVDVKTCPHCGAAMSAATAPAGRRAPGPEIVYGGSRATWWSRMSIGAKAANSSTLSTEPTRTAWYPGGISLSGISPP